MIKSNGKILKASLILGLAIMVLAGCQTAPKDSVAKVNGDYISKTEFDKTFGMVKKGYEAQFGPDILKQEGENGETFEKMIRKNILDALIMEKIELKEAKNNKISTTDEEVNELIKQYKEKLGGEKKYKEFLKDNFVDEAYFKEMVKKEITIEKYREDYINKAKATDEEARKFFEDNKESFEMVEASHILLEKEEDAKKVLEEIKNGGDFKALAKAKSKDEGSAKEGGSLGYFTREKMVPEFSKVAFSLKPGEISEIVKSNHGYHIIKVENKIDKYEKMTDEGKKSIIQNVKGKKLQEHLDKLREEADIKIYMKEDKESDKKADKDNNKENNKGNNKEEKKSK